MNQLSRISIAFVLCFLFMSPKVHACLGPTLEDTIFFNTNAQPLIFDNLGQPPPNKAGMIKPPADVDVIAEIFLTDFQEISSTAMATANVIRVLKTSDKRIRPGKKILMKFQVSSCGPNHRNGNKGIIAAKVGTDSKGRLVLCPYSRRFNDGQISLPSVSECFN